MFFCRPFNSHHCDSAVATPTLQIKHIVLISQSNVMISYAYIKISQFTTLNK
jgi:hypothetical protein